jgi:hypothetical protein
MLFREINVVYSDNYRKHINRVGGQNAGLLSDKLGGTYM